MDRKETVRVTSAFIRRLRQEACISQAELGRRIGQSRGYISRIERDCSRMAIIELSDIFCSVGRDVDEVLADWKEALRGED